MADLSKIKVGDELRVTLRVSVLYSDMVRVGLGQDYATVGKTWIEAAEHIPAPQVFKRGDWVWNIDKITKGLVVKVYPNGDIWVSWDTDEACPALHSPDFFELVEAPE